MDYTGMGGQPEERQEGGCYGCDRGDVAVERSVG